MEHVDPTLSYPHIVLSGEERYIALVDQEGQIWLSTRMSFQPHEKERGLVYARISRWEDGKAYSTSMHRMILERHLGDLGDNQIDHINGNTLDNRKINLRLATASQNAANKRRNQNKISSQYKGVFKSGDRYRARARFNGKIHNMGTFESELDAAIAYNILVRDLFGEFAKGNDIQFSKEDEARVKSLKGRPKFRAGKSKYRGIYLYRDRLRWVVRIAVKGRRLYVGIFEDEREAALAYNKAALIYHGENAYLNVVNQ